MNLATLRQPLSSTNGKASSPEIDHFNRRPEEPPVTSHKKMAPRYIEKIFPANLCDKSPHLPRANRKPMSTKKKTRLKKKNYSFIFFRVCEESAIRSVEAIVVEPTRVILSARGSSKLLAVITLL